MFKKLMIIILGICSVALTGCTIETPEIRGIVLDDETKQPIEGAWVHATLQIRTKTFQGATQTVLRVEPPHTRSNQKGEFVIPSISSLSVSARRLVEKSKLDSHLSRKMEELKSALVRNSKSQA